MIRIRALGVSTISFSAALAIAVMAGWWAVAALVFFLAGGTLAMLFYEWRRKMNGWRTVADMFREARDYDRYCGTDEPDEPDERECECGDIIRQCKRCACLYCDCEPCDCTTTIL